MNTKRNIRTRQRGYVSFLMVLSLGIVMLAMMVFTYKTSINAQEGSRISGLRVDYAAKEDEILRSVVGMVPNRAIRAMQSGSNTSSERNALRWKQIFSDALDQVNARDSITPAMKTQFQLTNTFEKAAIGLHGDSEQDIRHRLHIPPSR